MSNHSPGTQEAVIQKMARAMFDQDHDEGWDRGEPLTKKIYLANAEVGLAALKAGDGLPNGRRIYSEGDICQKETGAYTNGRRDGERRAAEVMREDCAELVDGLLEGLQNRRGVVAAIRALKVPS